MKRGTLIVFLLFSAALHAHGNIDSLLTALKTQKDGKRLATLRELAYEYDERNEFDSSLYFCNEGLALARQLGNDLFMGKFYSSIGVSYWNKGQYGQALDNLKKGLVIAKRIKDVPLLASLYNNLGLVYWEKGDYPKALSCLSKSLAMDKKLGDKEGMGSSILNIGLVYDDTKDYANALKYYKWALKLAIETKDNQLMGICYTNMGNVYSNQKDFQRGMECHVKSLKYSQKANDVRTMALANNNLGAMFFDRKEFDKARGFYDHALKLYNESGDISGVVLVMNNLGDINGITGNYTESIQNYRDAIAIADTNDMIDHLATSYKGMSQTLAGLNLYREAFEYHVKYKQLEDTLAEMRNSEEFNKMRTDYEVKQKEMELNARRAKEREVEQAEKRQQYFILGGVALFLLLTIIFSFFLFKRIRISQRQNKIIQQQKHLVEEKQQEILDSINYAQRIQQALLPHEQDLSRLFKYSFILFQPKDIVSGDFYWITEKGNYIFYATADCTGHGVPGGFMSMLGTSFLNEIINEQNVTDPGEVLNILRDKVISALRQRGSVGENKDGMDITLCRINKQKNELVYAAANNPLYMYRNNEVKEYKADKMPIGYYSEMRPFESKTLTLQSGDVIYTFTDGFADQFGGPKGKKYKYGQLIKNLQSYTAITTTANGLESVKNKLQSDFSTWKGKMEQTDDVCVIGVGV